MMTYHPPITTYTPEQEQRMQAVSAMAERMMARGYGYTRPTKYEPTPEPQLSAADYMTLAEVSECFGYGFGWLFDRLKRDCPFGQPLLSFMLFSLARKIKQPSAPSSW